MNQFITRAACASIALLGICQGGRAALVPILQQDFSASTNVSDYVGTAENRFDFIGVASTSYATTSITGGAFQMVTNYQDDPAQTAQQSATRLSRTKAATLPFGENFAVAQFTYRVNLTTWVAGDHSIGSCVIGENFRGSAFNPANAPSNGPAFVTMSVQKRATQDQFRVISGGGTGSSNFTITPDANGFHNMDFVMAFNSGDNAQTFESPTGSYTLNSESYAVWVNSTLIWSNGTTNTVTTANFTNISFGMGDGTNRTFAAAQPYAGTYQFDNIVVSTVPEPAAAALLALGALTLVRRRRTR